MFPPALTHRTTRLRHAARLLKAFALLEDAPAAEDLAAAQDPHHHRPALAPRRGGAVAARPAVCRAPVGRPRNDGRAARWAARQ